MLSNKESDMFGIAIRPDNGELFYWSGGEIFSVHTKEAVRIVEELDALNTIPILRKAIGLDETAHVVLLPDET
jgi:hypothetical protein